MEVCAPRRRNFCALIDMMQVFKQSVPENPVSMSTCHMRFVSMGIVAILILQLRVNILNFFAKRLHSALKMHLLKAPTNSALSGVRQTKKHASLIPEFHHIANSKPADKPSKLLTSPIPGGKGIGFVADVRIKPANLINALSQELRFEEARYHASLPQRAQTVLKGKNILLLRNFLRIMDLRTFGL